MSRKTENELISQDPDFSKGFLQLYSSIRVENASESLTLLLHAFLLESGFRPKGVEKDDVYNCMPENWKYSGIYKIQYNHEIIPEAFCWVTFVPLYNNLTLHGNTESEEAQERVYINLPFNTYLKEEAVLSDPSSVFKQLRELSKFFKDEFCFPLLGLLQEDANDVPFFGISGLVDDVKISIMKFLPVESVLSLSEVNKEFRKKSNSAYLWKHLFKRDFGLRCRDTATTSEEDWKKIYKMEYLKRKYREDPYITGHFPHPHPIWEPFHDGLYPDIDPGIDMDPALQQAFPHMRSRFRASNLFAPYDLFRRYRFL